MAPADSDSLDPSGACLSQMDFAAQAALLSVYPQLFGLCVGSGHEARDFGRNCAGDLAPPSL